MNSVNLIGRLGADPVARFTAEGTAVVNFSLAIDEVKKGGSKKAIWVNATAWGKTAEVLKEHAVKGQKLGIEGRLSQSDWTDKDGKKVSQLLVTADRIELLEKPRHEARASSGDAGNDPLPIIDHAHDVPF